MRRPEARPICRRRLDARSRPGHYAAFLRTFLAGAATLWCLLATLPAGAATSEATLTLVHGGGAPPYCFRNDRGQPDGFLVDYWRLWSSRTGVPVRVVITEREDPLALVAAGRADAHAGVGAASGADESLGFTRPVLDMGIGIFAEGGLDATQLETRGATLGLMLNDPAQAFLAATYPNLSQQFFLDLDALASAAVLGQVRVVAGPVLALRRQLGLRREGGRFELLRVFPGVQLRAAVRKENAALLARLNAGIEAISVGDVRGMEDKWAGQAWSLPPLAAGLGAGAAFMVAALVVLFQARKVRAAAQARIREADLLAGSLMAEMARHRKTQDMLTAAIEQSPSGIVLAFPDEADAPVLNRQALRLLGIAEPRNAAARPEPPPWRAFLPSGAALGPGELPLARALAQGETVQGTVLRLELGDGTERWISVNAAPVRDAQGAIQAGVLVFDDITEARQAGRELERFKFFLESGVEEVYLVRPDGTLAYVNEAVARSLGYPRADLLGQRLSLIDPAYTPERVEELLRLVRAGRRIFETLQLARSGRRVLKEVKAFYMRSGEEEFICAFGQDITERKRMQGELENTRALFHAALDQAITGIVIADAKCGRVLVANPAAAAMVDIAPEDMARMRMGRPLRRWSFHREDGTPYALSDSPLLRAAKNGEHTRDMVVRFQSAGGPERWLLVNAAPILAPDGAIQAAILVMTDITARKQMEAQLLFKAQHDPLTGLANRSLCLERIQALLEEALARSSLFAVAFIDLDRFKMLNDSLGHSFGDRVLVEAGRRLVAGMRGQGQVCRFGGDEFVLIASDPDSAEDAQDIIRKTLNALGEPFSIDGQLVRLTASVGVVIGPSQDCPSAEDILQNADLAMHRAKDTGRDRIRLFHPGMQRRAKELLALDADMRRALELDEYLVYYQPVMSPDGSRVFGLEALVRWKSPTRGLVTPQAFIPHAEESGLIVPLGELVLRRACFAMAAWRARHPGARGMFLAVNLSARQFAQQDIVETVRQILRASGLPPAKLKLELTESTLMSDPEAALSSMRRLKALGVSLAIDDFGTGYSSLAYLQRFPVDVLKIDRSFVRDLPRADSDSRELVRAIMALARTLRKSVVAEGVETREQLELLAELGCEAVQGFLFSPPLPEAGVPEFLGPAGDPSEG